MRNSFVIAFLVAHCAQVVFGHSWIACTDFVGKNAALYDHNKCRGYPRNGRKKVSKDITFGQDTGFDYRPSNAKPCRDGRDDQAQYDSKHPMAVYYPGQQVVLAHPMKNHGSDKCTNPYIPDHGNFIYRGEKDATTDPTLPEFKRNLVADLGIKNSDGSPNDYPKPGYQNAPAFCDNTDKALGTYSFNIPRNLEPGRYTFLWLWLFNSKKDAYTTCFEVDIVGSLEERNERLMDNSITDTYEPCGGTISNGGKGNENRGCTPENGGSKSTVSTTTSTTSFTRRTRTSTAAPGETSIPILIEQQGGFIVLPNPRPGVTERTVRVRWPCRPQVTYWAARNVGNQELNGGGVEHLLVQDNNNIRGRRIYYHLSLTEPCDMSDVKPQAALLSEK